ncbi:MAG: ABC transporter permease [Janthinobacterium lividum]
MLDMTAGVRPRTGSVQANRANQASGRRMPCAFAWVSGNGMRRTVSPLLILGVWQAASSSGLVSPQTLASPWRILITMRGLIADGSLLHNLTVSLARAGSGLAIAIVVGIVLALIAGLSRLGEDAIDAPMQMVRTLPALALVPLFILWFGIGETPKIALVALGALFPIYLNLFKGIRSVDPKLLEMGRTLGLSRAQTIRDIVLPGALPDLLVGLRFSVGISWLMLVVAEQVNANSGIGHMMMDAEDFLRTDIILVGLFIYAALGLISDQIVRTMERVFLAWRPQQVGLGRRG